MALISLKATLTSGRMHVYNNRADEPASSSSHMAHLPCLVARMLHCCPALPLNAAHLNINGQQ